MTLLQERLNLEELKERSRETFKKLKGLFGFTVPAEHDSVRQEKFFEEDYRLEANYFVSGVNESTQKISIEVFKGKERALLFTVEDGRGVFSLELGKVAFFVAGNDMGSSDRTALFFFRNSPDGAVELEENLFGKIQKSILTGRLEMFDDTELRSTLLPKKEVEGDGQTFADGFASGSLNNSMENERKIRNRVMEISMLVSNSREREAVIRALHNLAEGIHNEE
jgi:hypothetical protein